jgi:hypothetical protein
MSGDHGGGGGRRGISIFGGIVLLVLVLYGAQIYLNPPYARPVVVCWLPYQITRLVLVEAPKLVLPRDPEIPLDNSLRVARWNRECTCFLSGQNLLTGGQKPNLPFSCK